jgi:GT2 family glycosyltransferase
VNAPHPRASVIVPAHRSEATLPLCLEGLAAQTFQDFETIVVGASPDDPGARPASSQFGWTAVEPQASLSAGAARNLGAEMARGETIVFLDADCRPEPHWLERLLAAHDAGHQIVGGAIAGAFLHRGGRARVPGGWFARAVHLCKFPFWVAGGPPGERDQLPTANLSLDRSTWDSVGPFTVHGWCEDTELSWRARGAGLRLHFEPPALVTHYHRSGPDDFWRERVQRGRAFAAVRRRFNGGSRASLLVRLAGFPLVAPIMTARALRHAHRVGRLREALWLSPLVFGGYLGWSVGEAFANARMMGVSLRPRSVKQSRVVP